MRNDLTEIICILDASGSMSGYEGDVVGGINAVLEKQKKEEGEAFVTTVVFDTRYSLLHNRIPLKGIEPMTANDYTPGGCTALLDAIGRTLTNMRDMHARTSRSERPGHVIVTIVTDGMENASRRFSNAEVKRLIETCKADGWDFAFLGADIDAFAVGRNIGLGRDEASDFVKDGHGIGEALEAMNIAVNLTRGGLKGKDRVLWQTGLEDDFNKRSGRRTSNSHRLHKPDTLTD